MGALFTSVKRPLTLKGSFLTGVGYRQRTVYLLHY